MDETLNEYRSSEERSKRAMADAARLAEELRQEQEHAMHVDRLCKGLDIQIKEMQVILHQIVNIINIINTNIINIFIFYQYYKHFYLKIILQIGSS